MNKEKPTEWYKLDLSANVYPTLQRRTFSSVYRLTVTLTNEIRPVILQQALEMTLPRFPEFNVSLHTGLFWRYLEPDSGPPPRVRKDVRNPCMPMNLRDRSSHLIRVYYYGNQISLEAFHSLSDGNGALLFLQTMAAVYLRLTGISIPCGEGVLDITEEPPAGEMEDAYMKYANSEVAPGRIHEKTYRVRGTREPFYTLNIIAGEMTVEDLLKAAHSYHATVTEYLTSVLLFALQKDQAKRHGNSLIRPVKIALPVNLRSFFPTSTMRNFITMMYPGIDPRLGSYTFEEIIRQIHFYMQFSLNDKFLRADITTNALTQKNPFVRAAPLFVKDIIVRRFYKRVQDRQSSAGLTNLGIVRIPDEMRPWVARFDAIMGQPFSARTNCAVISYGNRTTVNFADSIVETDIERYFFQKLVQDHIHVTIRSNREGSMYCSGESEKPAGSMVSKEE